MINPSVIDEVKLWFSAGAVFALAVLAAGFAPLASLVFASSQAPTLSYSFGKDGAKASATFSRPAGTTSEIKLVAVEPSKETVVAAQRSVAGSDKMHRIEAAGALPSGSTAIRIVITCDAGSQENVLVTLQQPSGGQSKDDKLTKGPCVK